MNDIVYGVEINNEDGKWEPVTVHETEEHARDYVTLFHTIAPMRVVLYSRTAVIFDHKQFD